MIIFREAQSYDLYKETTELEKFSEPICRKLPNTNRVLTQTNNYGSITVDHNSRGCAKINKLITKEMRKGIALVFISLFRQYSALKFIFWGEGGPSSRLSPENDKRSTKSDRIQM